MIPIIVIYFRNYVKINFQIVNNYKNKVFLLNYIIVIHHTKLKTKQLEFALLILSITIFTQTKQN